MVEKKKKHLVSQKHIHTIFKICDGTCKPKIQIFLLAINVRVQSKILSLYTSVCCSTVLTQYNLGHGKVSLIVSIDDNLASELSPLSFSSKFLLSGIGS